MLRLQLLGGLDIRGADGRDFKPSSRKACGLLACLALPPGTAWSRDRLATIFWGDREDIQARGSVRQALTDLRRSFDPEKPLQVDRNSVRFDPAAVTVDAVEFETAVKAGDLERADTLYRGDLLDGFILNDSGFHDWLIVERTRLRDMAVKALTRLAASQIGNASIQAYQRVLQIDPTREEVHRSLMNLYVEQDQRALALRQFQICRDVLQRELGTGPDQETELLFQHLQKHTGHHAPKLPISQTAVSSAVENPTVAVLAFTNMSNFPEQEFFCDGVTEDIITDLSKVSGLNVLSRNFAFSYKGKAVNLELISKELGVAYVVEGSVRKAGQKIRINTQLTEGASGKLIWSTRYDRDLADTFAIQDEIAMAIVEQLKVKLLPEEKKAIEYFATESIEAYTHYLRGRQLFRSRTRSALTLARRIFSRAIELDPAYARAYAGLADCDSRLKSSYGVDISVIDVLAITEKALAIEPNLAEAHASRGHALMVGNRRAEAASAFERALVLDPDCYQAHDYYAQFCVTEGNFERAAKHYQRALELEPDDFSSPIYLVNIFRSLSRPEEAMKYARLGVKRAEAALALHPEDSKPAQLGALALVYLGEHDRAKDWLAQALAIDPDDNIAKYNEACAYSLLGEIDRAIDLLEAWLPKVGSDWRLWFKHDSDLDPIRGHPRYPKLHQFVSKLGGTVTGVFAVGFARAFYWEDTLLDHFITGIL